MATTVYVPVLETDAGFIVGFWDVEVKPAGPLQANVAPVVEFAPNDNAAPLHTLLPLNTGVWGV